MLYASNLCMAMDQYLYTIRCKEVDIHDHPAMNIHDGPQPSCRWETPFVSPTEVPLETYRIP